MRYISTRGQSLPYTFEQAVLRGLAADRGLLVPESLPDFSKNLERWTSLNYSQLAFEIIQPFVGDSIDAKALKNIIDKSYQVFDHPLIIPLKPFSGGLIVELYHGPTFAFKDIALQFLGNLFEHFFSQLQKIKLSRRAVTFCSSLRKPSLELINRL